MKKCPKTGKRSYSSKRAAKQQSKHVHNKFRCYLCPDCHSWHITARAGE